MSLCLLLRHFMLGSSCDNNMVFMDLHLKQMTTVELDSLSWLHGSVSVMHPSKLVWCMEYLRVEPLVPLFLIFLWISHFKQLDYSRTLFTGPYFAATSIYCLSVLHVPFIHLLAKIIYFLHLFKLILHENFCQRLDLDSRSWCPVLICCQCFDCNLASNFKSGPYLISAISNVWTGLHLKQPACVHMIWQQPWEPRC